MLLQEAPAILDIEGRHIESNRFMTTGFSVKREYMDLMAGVTNIDGTCRPHFVGDENQAYRNLLLNVKKTLGRGVVLNTSFNIHGEPIVCTPNEALDMFKPHSDKLSVSKRFSRAKGIRASARCPNV